jgi:hypothetical protein
MRENYRLKDDESSMMSMVWEYDDARSQKVFVRRFRAADRDMVEFKSAFARREDIEPAHLLRENSRLPLATVALSGEVYLVLYNALVASLSMSDLDFFLGRVAGVADTLEEKYLREDTF